MRFYVEADGPHGSLFLMPEGDGFTLAPRPRWVFRDLLQAQGAIAEWYARWQEPTMLQLTPASREDELRHAVEQGDATMEAEIRVEWAIEALTEVYGTDPNETGIEVLLRYLASDMTLLEKGP